MVMRRGRPPSPDSRGRSRAVTALASAVLAIVTAAVVGACGDSPKPLRISGVTEPTGTDRTACGRLAGALPSSLGHALDRRTVTPGTSFAAAWGDPPVVFSCGVSGVAASYRPSSILAEVDGIGWFAEGRAGSVRYSTPTRRPQVVVVVPSGADGFDVLTSLAPAVAADTRATTP
jgi:hypothetical protein